jgi:hypothetical protein
MTVDITLAPPILDRVAPLSSSNAPPYTSVWWLDRLTQRMYQRNRYLTALRAYYRGEQDTWRLASEAHRSAFGRLFDGLKSNLALPIVDAVQQRLTVEGFRFANDEAGSRKAWRLWQESGMGADSRLAHTEALSVGECPVIVWMEPGAAGPRITVEDPMQVYVEFALVDRNKALAGMKRWWDPDLGAWIAVLYLPDRVEWWQSGGAGWKLLLAGGNPLGRVPIVVLWNMPRLVEPAGRYSRGQGEHEAVYTLLDLYNKTLLDMATTSEFMAFPQRYAIGVTLEDESYVPPDTAPPVGETGSDGEVVQTEAATLQSGPNRLWKFEAPDTKVGQFATADLAAYATMLDKLRADISSATHTPHRKLLPPPTSVPPSGESVRLSDEGLTAKVRDRMQTFGDGWEQVIRLSMLWTGDLARAQRMDIETIWRDPEVRTESEHADALVKKASLGVPREALWRQMGATPQEIEEWRTSAPPDTRTTPPPGDSLTAQEVQ